MLGMHPFVLFTKLKGWQKIWDKPLRMINIPISHTTLIEPFIPCNIIHRQLNRYIN
jgi:hypothetical protein